MTAESAPAIPVVPGLDRDTVMAMMTGQGLEVARARMRSELEATCLALRDAILLVDAEDILGYLWAQLLIARMRDVEENRDMPEPGELADVVFALEYVHATLSSYPERAVASDGTDEPLKLVAALAIEARAQATAYALVAARLVPAGVFGDETGGMAIQAMTAWISIRGHRYQGLEREFFAFILSGHDEALVRAYGVDSAAIAAGIQAAVDATRFGHMRAIEAMHAVLANVETVMESTGKSMDEVMSGLQADDAQSAKTASDAAQALFFGGLVNVTRESGLPAALLDDLSFVRGQDKEFFAEGELMGTPLRTLPARVKPLVALNGQHYACDPNFLRDSAYRAIQRGLRARLPDDAEGWKNRQTRITERAFAAIFSKQLRHAEVFETVYYKDVVSGAWVENDVLILLDDVMLQIEVKAGVMAMHSPELKLASHVRAIQDLVVKARAQCERFLRHAASAEEVPIYALRDGQYVEVRRLRLGDYRLVVPIGLTVEAFTPFSSMCKRLPTMEPILGRFPFVSMSIDDLFVLTRLLPTAGELTHYFTVRQALAGMPQILLHDEIDHLGAYIDQNRPDQTYAERLKEEKPDLIVVDGMSRPIDMYFGDPDWERKPPPSQFFPALLSELLRSIDVARRDRYLAADSAIRNFGAKMREDADAMLRKLLPTLSQHPARWFTLSSEPPLMFRLLREDAAEANGDFRERAKTAAAALNAASCDVITVYVVKDGSLGGGSFASVTAPVAGEPDYAKTQERAAKLGSSRFIDLSK